MSIPGPRSISRIMAAHLPFNSLRVFFYRAGGVKIGKGTIIERGIKIGEEVSIGDGSVIHHTSNIHHCSIGNEARIENLTHLTYVHIGNRSIAGKGSVIIGNRRNWVRIGDDVGVSAYSILDGVGGLEIEDKVDLGSDSVGVFTHSSLKNRLLGLSFRSGPYLQLSPIKIGTCSWIGGKVLIQPGVTIGPHSIVMPNSTVIGDVPPYTMMGGVPAKPLKRIRLEGEKVEFIPLDI